MPYVCCVLPYTKRELAHKAIAVGLVYHAGAEKYTFILTGRLFLAGWDAAWYNLGIINWSVHGRANGADGGGARFSYVGERKMNIQIFGKSKCFDTKKAERWFKERRIKFQSVDLIKYGMSPGELKSVAGAVGLAALIDPKHPDAALLNYLAYDADKLEKLLENPKLLRTPIVRNGRQATVGYCPEVWQGWS